MLAKLVASQAEPVPNAQVFKVLEGPTDHNSVTSLKVVKEYYSMYWVEAISSCIIERAVRGVR